MKHLQASLHTLFQQKSPTFTKHRLPSGAAYTGRNKHNTGIPSEYREVFYFDEDCLISNKLVHYLSMRSSDSTEGHTTGTTFSRPWRSFSWYNTFTSRHYTVRDECLAAMIGKYPSTKRDYESEYPSLLHRYPEHFI